MAFHQNICLQNCDSCLWNQDIPLAIGIRDQDESQTSLCGRTSPHGTRVCHQSVYLQNLHNNQVMSQTYP